MFRDEYEAMTSVPHGHDAFYILAKPVPPVADPEPKRSRYRSKTEQTLVALMSEEEKAERRRKQFLDRSAAQSKVVAKAKKKNAGFGSLLGLSQAGDERIRQHKEREAAITARKPISSFNTAIATPDESRKTNSIKGRL